MIERKIKKPVICSEYINIYKPQPDIYKGVNTENFVSGEKYDEWITNDFTVIHENGIWHIFGITHPKPKGFVSAFECDKDVHEAEYQLFHCTAKGKSFSDVFKREAFKDENKILYPQDRPGERKDIWAPHIDRIDDEYCMIYSPEVMRYAKSKDLITWENGYELFKCNDGGARDPFLFHDDNGDKYLLFCEQNVLKYRKTRDMINWSEEVLLQTNPFSKGASESPFMLKRDGMYYLMWCIYDTRNGCYDNRTYVFASETIDGFEGLAPITMLEGHAPEFVVDGDDTYILSAFYPENGICAAKIKWR